MRAADPGPTRFATASRSQAKTRSSDTPPAEWVRLSAALRPGIRWEIADLSVPRSIARTFPDPVDPLQSRGPHPRTRPAGPPIRGPLASQQQKDRFQKQALTISSQQSGSRLSAGAPAGNAMGDRGSVPKSIARTFQDPGIPLQSRTASPDKARRAADPGPTRFAIASRSRAKTELCDKLTAEWVPALRCAPAGNALEDQGSVPKSVVRPFPDPGTRCNLAGRIPGQGPKGRRSGAYSLRNRSKIASENTVLRQVHSRVGPGSPLRCGRECAARLEQGSGILSAGGSDLDRPGGEKGERHGWTGSRPSGTLGTGAWPAAAPGSANAARPGARPCGWIGASCGANRKRRKTSP